MSVSSTSPALLFGGVWEQIEDRFLLSAGSKQANSEGGSETITLSQENLPSDIVGGFGMYTNGGKNGGFDGDSVNGVFSPNPNGFGGTGNYPTGQYSTAEPNPTNYIAFDLGGSSTPINVMPPYLVVYMWARVA